MPKIEPWKFQNKQWKALLEDAKRLGFPIWEGIIAVEVGLHGRWEVTLKLQGARVWLNFTDDNLLVPTSALTITDIVGPIRRPVL